jgi:hypothetical protein
VSASDTDVGPDRRPRSPWERFLFTPERPSPAALLRIVWGALAALWALTLLPDVDPLLTDGALGYDRPRGAWSWNPLDLVDVRWAPLAACVLLLVSAMATGIGYRTRLSSTVAVLCMLSLQRTNPTIFNSGDLALRQVGIAVALAPSGLLLSLDERRRRGTAAGGAPDPRRAPWAMRLLQLELAFGYLLSAWSKLRGATWHEGTALGLAMRVEDLQRFAVPEWVFDQALLLNALTWASLLFEAGFVFLVWNRRLRPWVLGVGVAFHLGIDVVFDVGFFSWTMIAAYLAFVPPHVADRWIDAVRGWWRDRRSAAPVPLAVEPAE